MAKNKNNKPATKATKAENVVNPPVTETQETKEVDQTTHQAAPLDPVTVSDNPPVENETPKENDSLDESSEKTDNSFVFAKPSREVLRVFLHCSASDNPAHDNVETITAWHLARKFDTIGYHYYISKDGVIHQGRSLERVPAAQQGHNTGTIAICLGGLAEENFTEAQFESLAIVCKAIDEAYGGEVTFHGHREVSAKECPVLDYKSVLKLDAKGRLGV